MFRTAFARCPLDGSPLEPFDEDPLLGSTFADRYVIEELTGEGAMGRVYRARHTRVSRHFAVKVLFGDHGADAKMQERFAREAEAASRLQHPNVVPVLDFGETEAGVLYLVMDYVEGSSLTGIIAREAPLEPDRTRDLLRQLCSGLAHAHDRGLVHRDFKSDNVIVTGEGDEEIPRIADFGIAVLFDRGGESSRLTTDGIVLGTPAYMAPEQATREPVDHRADLFSLGVVVYEMISGMLPFDGTALEVARQNLNDDPPPIAKRAPLVPGDEELERVARRLMAKDPAERFASAREVMRALRRMPTDEGAAVGPSSVAPFGASDEAPSGKGASLPDREPAPEAARGTEDTLYVPAAAYRPPKRRRALAGAAALALAAAAAALLIAYLPQRGGGASPTEPVAAGAPVSADASAPPADAAAPTAFTAADAAVAAAERTDAGSERRRQAGESPPAERSETPDHRRQRPREGRSEPRATAGDPAAGADEDEKDAREDPSAEGDGGVSREALTYRYRAVGAGLQGLGESAEAKRLREAYLSLPYAAALRDPERRDEVYRQLRQLESELRSMGTEP